MKNREVARILDEIAGLLELKGENVFKIRAYQKAARSLEQLPVDIERLAVEGRLKEVPGVGEAIATKITQLVTSGRLEYYEKLKAEFPPGVSVLLTIPGIGPKTALKLATELEIRSLEELEAAIADGRVAGLFRMGEKTAENILRQLRTARSKEQRIPIGEALPVVDEITSRLKELPGLLNISPAGSLRRFRETIGDIDLMGTAENPGEIIEAFVRLPLVRHIIGRGPTKASVLVSAGLQVDLRIVEHEAFGSLLQYFTGSKQHNISLRERARRRGLSLSEYGITEIATGRLEKFATEEAFYQRQGLQYIPPELREGQHEIARAEAGGIPELVQLPDFRGDLHSHTDWSDGRSSIEEMAIEARSRGYRYLAITDHSMGRGIARGLDSDRLRRQAVEIKDINARLDGIRLLTGCEVDIRSDGSLDLADDVLAELDFVIAAMHSGLGQPGERVTARLLSAIANPNVDMISHPTGRMMPDRPPVAADMEAVFRAAARHGTILEINSMPNRLDLKDSHIYRARELGVRLAISSDAHSTKHFELVRFGVGIARRGWCRAEDIVNTWSLEELTAHLQSRGSLVG